MRTIADVIAATRMVGSPLPAPEYTGDDVPGGSEAQHHHDHVAPKMAFMVASMRTHTTDEGYALALALNAGGFHLIGHGFDGQTDVARMVGRYDPATVVIQDKREWTGRTAGPGFDHRERFGGVNELARRVDIFKGTVLKDAHSDHPLHVQAAHEIGCHFWVVYYDPRIVAAQAPFVRPEHLVRTWHSVDPEVIPPFGLHRSHTVGILSGALSRAYPLRSRLALVCQNGTMRHLQYKHHPGYGRQRCHTPGYLQLLSTYRVAVCTSSRFGYAVRKIVEATACGCRVVTDLPTDEVLPEIDGNLIRVDPDIAPGRVDELVGDLCATWDEDRQREWAARAKRCYDYRALGVKLAVDIEALRRRYNDPSTR